VKKRWGRTAVVVSVIGLSGLIVGSAIPVASQQPPERTTLTFFDPRRTDYDKFVNAGRRGFSPGDVLLFIEKLRDPETCDPAGRIIGKFTVSKLVGRQNAFFQLDFGFRLPDGTITGYHAGKFSDFESETRNRIAVTGGTDAYRDATGEFTIVPSEDKMCGSRGDLITVDLLLE
jgi:hypothetical protein